MLAPDLLFFPRHHLKDAGLGKKKKKKNIVSPSVARGGQPGALLSLSVLSGRRRGKGKRGERSNT